MGLLGKNINRALNSIYSQKRLDYAEQSATNAIKTASKRTIQ